MTTPAAPASLDAQHDAFLANRFLAMPIAGAIAWTGIGIAGALLPTRGAAYAVFIGTGAIFYLGILVGRLTGEDLFGRGRPANLFDRIFLMSVAASLCAYGIAIPFLQADPTSLPLSVGILTGTMWLPFGALARHWVGLFHAVTRTLLVVAAWYLAPGARFTAIPAVIVAVYLVTIVVLRGRWRAIVAARA